MSPGDGRADDQLASVVDQLGQIIERLDTLIGLTILNGGD